MPNPNFGTFALGHGVCPLAPARLTTRIGAARTATWIGNTACTLATRFLAWRARRVTLHLLSSLDAATLRDLGIGDVESAVYGDPADRMRGYDRHWWR